VDGHSHEGDRMIFVGTFPSEVDDLRNYGMALGAPGTIDLLPWLRLSEAR
jgi:hypothetical protein